MEKWKIAYLNLHLNYQIILLFFWVEKWEIAYLNLYLNYHITPLLFWPYMLMTLFCRLYWWHNMRTIINFVMLIFEIWLLILCYVNIRNIRSRCFKQDIHSILWKKCWDGMREPIRNSHPSFMRLVISVVNEYFTPVS